MATRAAVSDTTPMPQSLEVALRLLRRDAPGEVMDAPQDWPRSQVLLPHVLAATSHHEHLLGTGTEAGPGEDVTDLAGDVSWLLDWAGGYLLIQGQPAAARPLLERALAIDDTTHDPDHPAVAAALNNLALVLHHLGDPAAAPWPSEPWPSPRPPTAPTTPPSPCCAATWTP